jgi:TPR repeat protein
MTSEHDQGPADYLFSEGMRYDLRQDTSLAAASLARANFQQAAAMGHSGAVRALAHLIFEGRGGPQDKEKGLLLLWSAFRRGDYDALEELGDLLASYSEQMPNPLDAKRTALVAETIAELRLGLDRVSSFMREIAQSRVQ